MIGTDTACRARRMQSIVDILISIMLAMLIWPFPIARATLTPVVHVTGVLAACVIVQLGYFTISAIAWQRTLGMRLAGLTIESADGGPLARAQGVKWGLISAVIALWFAVAPDSACAAAVAEKASGTRVAQV